MLTCISSIWRPLAALFLAAAAPFAHATRPTFTYDDLRTLIDNTQPSTPAQLLQRLPPMMKSEPLLMHKTFSQDIATKKAPRIILFNEDASLLLAFSGSKDNPRGDFVEVIHFNKQTKKFIPTEISLVEGKSPQVRENPQECYGCHGPKEFRPVWRAYDTWIGAYGVRHRDDTRPSARDAWDFWQFRRHVKRTHDERFTSLNINTKVADQAQTNSNFTYILGRLNEKRVAHLILDSVGTSPEKLLPIMFALKESPDDKFLNTLTPALAEEYKLNKNTIFRKVHGQSMRDFRERTEQVRQIHGNLFPFDQEPFYWESFYYFDYFTRLNFLESHGMMDPISEWPTTVRGRILEFATPRGDFFERLSDEILRQLPDWRPLHQAIVANGLRLDPEWFLTPEDCDDLLVTGETPAPE